MKLTTSHIKLVKQLTFAGIVTTALVVFAAQRRVTILASKDGSTNKVVTLLNGSSNSVNYTISCYSNGTVMYSNISQTLTAKGSKTYGNVGGCSGGASLYSTLNGGVASCYGYNFSQRANACASGYTVCSLAEATSAVPDTNGYSGWVEVSAPYNNSASNSFEVSDWSGTFTGAVNYSGYVAYFNSGWGSNYKCQPVGGGTILNSCNQGYASSSNTTMCCPIPGATTSGLVDNCDVSINSSEAGFLQSPQFKGGAPF